MQTVFRIAYSLTVAILLILTVILGTRTLYPEPERPREPLPTPVIVEPPPPAGGLPEEPLYCQPDGRCYKGKRELTPAEEAELSEEEQRYIQESREFFRREQEYRQERADHRRNVFIAATAIAVAAVGAGLYLFRRVEAIPLGLLLGGLGTLIFGWAQAAEDFGEIGPAPLFVTALLGLAAALAVGYWLLGPQSRRGGSGDP